MHDHVTQDGGASAEAGHADACGKDAVASADGRYRPLWVAELRPGANGHVVGDLTAVASEPVHRMRNALDPP